MNYRKNVIHKAFDPLYELQKIDQILILNVENYLMKMTNNF
jgi:hypothetical protein